MEQLDFDQQVIQRSHEIPVVVDFWAEWCGPCRMLGPVIEQLAGEQAGKWELVKLNTEHQPDVARQYGVMSIPNVKMFRDGKVVAEFVGAQPRSVIEKWLAQHIPSQEQEVLKSLLEEESNLTPTQFRERLQAFIKEHPAEKEPRLLLATRLVFEDPLTAKELVSDFQPGHEYYTKATDIREIANFLEAPLEEEDPAQAPLLAAQKAFGKGELEIAIQRLIEAVGINKSYADDLPRKTAVAVFRLLGDQHALSKNYRWRFDMALY